MLNKATIIGRLGRDVEIRQLQSGDDVANLSVATTEKWKSKSGEAKEKTEWHRVVMFGKLAGIAGKYLSKGSLVYIEGKLQTRKWTDQAGVEKYSTEIVCSGFDGVMKMLGEKNGNGESRREEPPHDKKTGEVPADDGLDDDIPF